MGVSGDFAAAAQQARCLVCGSSPLLPVRDYGLMPPADAFLATQHGVAPAAPGMPLQLAFCPVCSLLQLLDAPAPGVLFGEDYVYLSSCSDSWLAAARANAAQLVDRFGLDQDSQVVEVASNDGYLLRWFQAAGVPVLGIDPAPLPAKRARALGVETHQAFFNEDYAQSLAEGLQADLLISNNVLAHVPDPHDFVRAVLAVLAPGGSWVIEVPLALELLRSGAFDTVYHEHRCYFSLHALQRLLAGYGLHVNDLQRLPTHGGSARLFVSRSQAQCAPVKALLAEEEQAGLLQAKTYQDFVRRADERLAELSRCLLELDRDGRRIAAYGAAAKGTILLNSLGPAAACIRYVVDRNPAKHGRQVPGVQIPIHPPEQLHRQPVDVLLLLPWNLEAEISAQLGDFIAQGGRIIVPLPELHTIGADGHDR